MAMTKFSLSALVGLLAVFAFLAVAVWLLGGYCAILAGTLTAVALAGSGSHTEPTTERE